MPQSLSHTPVPYSAEVEVIPPDEAETTRELMETMRKIGETTYQHSGHARRSVHAKSHGILHGTLTVIDGLPPELRQGLFAEARSYPVTMRFSTPPAEILSDKVSLSRALAFKIEDVPGERLPNGVNATSQDFVMVNGPAFMVSDAKAFLGNLKLLAKTTEKGSGAKEVLSAVLQTVEKGIEALGGESGKLKSMGGHAETHILGESFFTQVPIRYGDHIAKVSLAPVSSNLTALKDKKLEMAEDDYALRNAVSRFSAGETAEWELRVQLCTDLEKMPVEDAKVAWDEKVSPYVAVATLVVGPQESWGDTAEAEQDRLSFSPWNALAAHRPLGGINRARRPAYEMSARLRAERNAIPLNDQA